MEIYLMPERKSRKTKYISYTLRFAVAAAALYLAFRKQNLADVSKVLLGLNLWVFAAALGIYIISQLIFVSRWYLLLWVQSIRIGFWPAVRLHFLGLFYNNCLPSAVGGDLLRAWYVTRHTDKKLEAALSVFVDRVVGTIGIAIMAFFSYWFIPADGLKKRLSSQTIGGNFFHYLVEYKWGILAAAAVLVIAIAAFIITTKGRLMLHRSYGFVREHSAVVISKVHKAIRIYYNKKLALALALLLTFACQGTFIIGLLLIGLKIGMTAPVKYYFIFFPISWLLGTLPISVGGAGIMEWWLIAMFTMVSTGSAEQASALASALALSQRLLWLTGSLPGVVIHLQGAHLPKDFSIDCKDSTD